MARITIASAKAKGRQFEDRVAAAVGAWLGVSSGIGDDHEVKRTRAASSHCDIELSARLKPLFPYWFECKNHRVIKMPEWIKQVLTALARNKDNRIPVIVFKLHGTGQAWATVPLEVFLQLATEHLNDLRERGELEQPNE